MNKIAKNAAQQGDVCLKKIDALPVGKTKLIKNNKRNEIVLAEGETTGHYHGLMEPTSELLEINGIRILNLKKKATLKHQEHKPITLDAGIWQVGIVNEYDYFSQMKRNVVD
jgi:hypothetical protein